MEAEVVRSGRFSGCILKVEPRGLADWLDVGMREGEESIMTQIFGSVKLPCTEMGHTVEGAGFG